MLAQAYHRHSRFLAALVFGGLMWAASRALPVDPVMSGLIAINSFFLGYLALILTMILRSTPEKMRRHSEQDDEGAVLILGIALLAVGISLSAIFLVLNRASTSPLETAFALAAAPLGWPRCKCWPLFATRIFTTRLSLTAGWTFRAQPNRGSGILYISLSWWA